jgi:hypothetical protein
MSAMSGKQEPKRERKEEMISIFSGEWCMVVGAAAGSSQGTAPGRFGRKRPVRVEGCGSIYPEL